MKAMVYRRYGGPEVLEPAELPEPKTHVDSVLVRVRAAGLNPADLALQAGALDGAVDTYFPVVPGWDIAGVVERAGPAAPEFAPGDEVVGYLRGEVQRAHGGLAELVSADVRTLVRKPRSLGFAEAAALPLAGLTAYQAVVHTLDVQPGEILLVHGAAGGVGSLAVQIARSLGARVIGTASVPRHGYLRTLGAEPVSYGRGTADRVRQLVPDGADVVLDTVGGVLAATAGAARPGARVASVVETGTPGVTPVFCRMSRTDLTALTDLAGTGELTVRVGATYSLDHAADAQRALAAGGIPGKVVIEIT
ncbi:NADP-dependent oxidoreductase [Streptomyces pseudovenezuelae]|uniref:NADPH:quinone reductase-like Zn-dependent oxidoreductase n=1 Tax=Streptomyces pseudovenezuelae TaxID=67350 RepID=A0ABT6LEZ0_9ACTN|nr:NADP-dependent oxidoreductase [Streptomyces pseudovenezuelae]MDH6214881.1 NADPH:quinone reductase-like Zn-dependent oxidoreductase [Streptomyces pseudovenezuelae]